MRHFLYQTSGSVFTSASHIFYPEGLNTMVANEGLNTMVANEGLNTMVANDGGHYYTE